MAYNKGQVLLDNINAIRVAIELERNGDDHPTPEQIEILQKYNGFGGLKVVLQPAETTADLEYWPNKSEHSLFPMVQELYFMLNEANLPNVTNDELIDSLKNSVLTSFYTPEPIVKAISDSISELRLDEAGEVRLLDPSSGMGIFGSTLKDFTDGRTYIEKDALTSLILQKLNSGDRKTIVLNKGFESISLGESNGVADIVASNIPFGDIKVFDSEFNRSSNRVKVQSMHEIHNYFFVKALDVVRPGGLVAFVTSRAVLDSNSSTYTRKYLMQYSNLVSAIRLPDGLFSDNAGTEVGSDLIVLQKLDKGRSISQLNDEENLFLTSLKDKSTGILENTLFAEENDGFKRLAGFPHKSVGTDPYGKPAYVYNFDGDMDALGSKVKSILQRDLSTNFDETLYNDFAQGQSNVVRPELDLTPVRPLSVPEEAVFDDERDEWFLATDSQMKGWTATGILKHEEDWDFDKNMPNGVSKTYWPSNGRLNTYTTFDSNGVKNGFERSIDLQGSTLEGFNVDGKKEGLWLYSYDFDNGEVDRYIYKDDKVIYHKSMVYTSEEEKSFNKLLHNIPSWNTIAKGIATQMPLPANDLVLNDYVVADVFQNGTSVLGLLKSIESNNPSLVSLQLTQVDGQEGIVISNFPKSSILYGFSSKQNLDFHQKVEHAKIYFATEKKPVIDDDVTIEVEQRQEVEAKQAKIEQSQSSKASITPTPPRNESSSEAVLPKPKRKRKSKKSEPDENSPRQVSMFDNPDFLANEVAVSAPKNIEKPQFDPSIKDYTGQVYKHYKNSGVLVREGKQLGHLTILPLGGNTFTPIDFSISEMEKLDLYIKVRDDYQLLYTHEAGFQEEGVELRQQLNRHYDEFVSRFGHLNKKENRDLISEYDNISAQVFGIEKRLDNDEYVKSDIFARPVTFLLSSTGYVNTPLEALSASLNKLGVVDMGYMRELLPDTDTADIVKALAGKIYWNPLVSNFELAEQFVAGNVVVKSEQVAQWMDAHPNEAHLAEESLLALKEAIPSPIPFADIDFGLGERWIGTGVYSQFASDLFNEPITVIYNPATDDFDVRKSPDSSFYNREIYDTYCVQGVSRRYDGIAMLRYALTDTLPEMTKPKKIEDSLTGEIRTVRVPDGAGLQVAQNIKEKIRNEFGYWLDRQPLEFKQAMASTYNRLFNGRAKVKYDGSLQSFPNLDFSEFSYKELYQSQKDAIWMLKVNGGGIVDHEVGGGKTMIMAVAAYEMKRLGLVNKPMVLCKKANYTDIAETFSKAYPNARIFAPSEDEMQKSERDKAFSDIQNNDWDIIVLTHDNFMHIPQSLEVEEKIIRDELSDVEANLMQSLRSGVEISKRALSALERSKNNLTARLLKVQDDITKRKDDIVDFKMMGIDHLFIDESHLFKNLTYSTRHTRVAGLGNNQGSQRALNILTAIRTIQARNGGKDLGVTFVSGTTVSNSLTELYLLFKYLRPKALEEQGIRSFDAWAAVFATKSVDYEFSVTNEIKQKERFRKFKNAPELGAFYSEITDFRTADDIGLDRPEANVTLYDIPQTRAQADFLDKLVRFAETGNGALVGRDPLTEAEDKARMLLVTNYAAKMSLDMRLISSDYEDDIDNKASHCAKMVAEYYFKFNEQKGTQFVFSDLATWQGKNSEGFDIYTEIKRKLVEDYEIPADEIRFMQEAKDDEEKKKFSEAMNRGEIRVMFGSTETLGTGVNAQERAVAIHHLDTPWVPSAVEQRNGRGVRTGNWVAKEYNNNKVDIYLYAVERTLDAYKFNLLQNKQQFITQLKKNTGSRTIDEGNMDANNGMNYAEFVAVVSGNTALLDKVKLERKISSLESVQNSFRKEKYKAQERRNAVADKLDIAQKRLSSAREDEKLFNSKLKKNQKGETINELVVYDLPNEEDIEKLSGHLHNLEKKERTNNSYKRIGEVYGFPIMIKSESSSKKGMFEFTENRFFVKGTGGILYSYNNGRLATDPKLATENFVNSLKKIPSVIEGLESQVQNMEQELKKYDKILSVDKFDKADELEALRKELAEVEKKIDTTLKSPGEDDDDVEKKLRDEEERAYELMPTDLEAKLPKLYQTEKVLIGDRVAYGRYFHPISSYTSYILEYDSKTREAFGLTNMGYGWEIGYMSLDEMEELKVGGLKIERDLHFTPTPLHQINELKEYIGEQYTHNIEISPESDDARKRGIKMR